MTRRTRWWAFPLAALVVCALAGGGALMWWDRSTLRSVRRAAASLEGGGTGTMKYFWFRGPKPDGATLALSNAHARELADWLRRCRVHHLVLMKCKTIGSWTVVCADGSRVNGILLSPQIVQLSYGAGGQEILSVDLRAPGPHLELIARLLSLHHDEEKD